MGAKQSSSVGGKLSASDLDRLQRRFRRLAGQGDSVSISQIQSMVELGANPFIPRIFQMFDLNKDGMITLDEFTKAIEMFGQLGSEEEQYKFAFRIYDINEDGLISSDELYSTLHGLVGQHYSDAQLEQIVTNTMAEFDMDGDNMLSLEEFKMLLTSTDLQSKFALSL
uniref:EF-hand domain-containing protein n=1 Tax=Chlamydomonas euryale TaxID=1486919 RepID=A0A7R9V8B7_9CHLO|mmetsp:Transcript_24971/g.73845  ORF Transcript_24971/g.73845 Transcript_24971/m.73845 type:complete len:168 (+) Transcript_24971:58-561(+)